MLPIWLAGFVLAALAGLFVLFAYERRIRTIGLAFVSIFVVCLIGCVGFVAYPIAHNATQATAIGGYQQMLNGSIIAANVEDTHCYEAHEDSGGSNCHHTERCDEYTDWEWQSVYVGTDSKGNAVYQSVLVPVDKWNDCPLASDEYTYMLTAVAYHTYTFTIASHIFGPGSKYIRGNADGVPTTVPAQWQKAKDDLAAGNSDAVTVPDVYDNYILGSESQLLEAQSNDINKLLDKSLLPSVTTPVHDNFLADKMNFVGMQQGDQAMWQDDLMRFNAAFGTTKQGDLHVVALKASALSATGISPDDYIQALKAHWQSDFGKNAFPKNAVVIVLAVDNTGKNIQWARAETGMPIGNHEMLNALAFRLQNQLFNPSTVFGSTSASVTGGTKVTYKIGSGIIPQTVMHDFPFDRACMGCTSASDQSKGQQGFVDLKSLIPVSGWAIFWTIMAEVAIAFVLTALVMGGYGFATGRTPRFYEPSYSYRSNRY